MFGRSTVVAMGVMYWMPKEAFTFGTGLVWIRRICL